MLDPTLDFAVCRALHGSLEARRTVAARLCRRLARGSLQPIDLEPWLTADVARRTTAALLRADVLACCRDDLSASTRVTASIFAWFDEASSIAQRAVGSAGLDAAAVLTQALDAGAASRWGALVHERRARQQLGRPDVAQSAAPSPPGPRTAPLEEVERALLWRRGGAAGAERTARR